MASRKVTLQDAATATGVGGSVTTVSANAVVLDVRGTFVGTVTFQGTVDGIAWYNLRAVTASDGAITTTTTTTGLFIVSGGGLKAVRANITVYTSGSITVLARASRSDLESLAATTLPAGESHIGQVGGEGDTFPVNLTVTAGAYAANDAVGGRIEFVNAARTAAGGGVIKDLIILDDAGQDAEMELWLFEDEFTAMANNAPWAPSEADLRLLVAIISTAGGAWFAAGTPSAARVEASQRYDCVGTSLYGQLVTRGTPTFVATDDVSVILGLLQD